MSFAQKDVLRAFRKPGEKPEVRGAAPTQIVYTEDKNLGDEEQNITGFVEKTKQRQLDRWLDKVVQVSGSYFVFLSLLTALLVWAFLGIKFGRDVTWQVIISDAQAIICYIFDSFLCRQQLNAYEDDIEVAAQLQSRSESHLRMLSKLKETSSPDEQEKALTRVGQSLHVSGGIASQLPSEDLFGRFITFVAFIIGHMVTILLFWAGVFAWIGIGHLYNYSNEWQLYMNSASSALMVFTFIFIANIGQRHVVYTKKCLDAFFLADSSLELQLRSLTNDVQINTEVVIPAPKVGKIQRAIFYYADFVGTLVGIAILITVMVAWLAVGPAVKFSSNWWLFIGTYAGLVGMFDGFVLRNMQSQLRSYTNKAMRVVDQRDGLLFEIIGLSLPVTDSEEKMSLTRRVSQTLDRITSHQFAVVAGLLTVIGLIVGSTVMGWSLTGQLLCNVPPSIIESFLMIVLITGHNSIEEKKRTELLVLYERRMRLLDYVEKLKGMRNEATLCSKGQEAVVDTTLI